MTDSKTPRPQAGDGSSKGTERYLLIKAAFEHSHTAFFDRRFLEVITITESILTDRLGSMVQGSLGHPVTLRQTLGDLIRTAEKNHVIAAEPLTPGELPHGVRAPFPPDVIEFLRNDLRAWWNERNDAVHGMAKLRKGGDMSFQSRYADLEHVALDGIRVLHRLDFFDQREKWENGAGRSATFPDALNITGEMSLRIAALRKSAG